MSFTITITADNGELAIADLLAAADFYRAHPGLQSTSDDRAPAAKAAQVRKSETKKSTVSAESTSAVVGAVASTESQSAPSASSNETTTESPSSTAKAPDYAELRAQLRKLLAAQMTDADGKAAVTQFLQDLKAESLGKLPDSMLEQALDQAKKKKWGGA
jgi:hypothetical protein